MSDKGIPVDMPGEDDSVLFNSLVGEQGETPEDQQEQPDQEGQEQDGEPEGETEGEPQGRARDDAGRFKKAGDEQQDAQPQARAEDRHAAGLRREMTDERRQRQAAEDRARQLEQDFARKQGEYEARLRQLEQARVQQAQPKPEPQQAPDRWADPDGYDRWREAQIEARFNARLEAQQAQRVQVSFQDANVRHGEAFTAAYRAADALNPQDPATRGFLDRVKNAPDPATYLMEWHKQELARREIGVDPAGYRDRTRADLLANPAELMKDPAFAKAVADHFRAQAGQAGPNGGPRNLTALPPSLNTSRGSNATRGRGVFESATQGW